MINEAMRIKVLTINLLLVFAILGVLAFGAIPLFAAIDSSSFSAPQYYPTDPGPVGLVNADFDGDGKLDVAVANYGCICTAIGNTITVFRNVSAGGPITFTIGLTLTLPAEAGPHSLAVGDIDGDGKPDLAVSNYGPNGQNNTVYVYRNTSTIGQIQFATPVSLTTGKRGPIGIAIGDLDGDGKRDLAVVSYFEGSGDIVSVFRNTTISSTLTFAPVVTFTVGMGPYGLAISDIDQDGKNDLVVTNYGTLYGSGNTVSILKNTTPAIGIISFDAPINLSTPSGPRGIAITDIDGDTKPDLAIGNFGAYPGWGPPGNTISLFQNISSGGTISFTLANTLSAGNSPLDLSFDDFDQNGKPDLAVTNYMSGTVSIFAKTGSNDFSFAPRIDFTAGAYPHNLVISDFTGNGILDLAVSMYGDGVGNQVAVFRNALKVTPSFSNLSSPTISYGTTNTTLSGTIKAGTMIPSGNITITVNGVAQLAAIDAATGNFSSTFATGAWAVSGSPYTIAYEYGGDLYFNAIGPDVSKTLIVNKVTPSFSNLSSPTITYGDPSTNLSGTIKAGTLIPSGSVSITLNGVPQSATIDGSGNFTSSFATSSLPVSGSPYAITYNYPGDSNFNSVGPDSSKSLTVNKANTTTMVTTSKTPTTFGESVTFTATVTSGQGTPSGSVTFKDGASTIGTGTLDGSGQATLTISSLAGGTHSITAQYDGNSNFNSSVSSSLTQIVNASSTTTDLTSDPNPSIFGQTVTFTATVASGAGAPTGSVTFKDGSTSIGSGILAGGIATFTTSALTAGSHSITAVYAGSTNYATSTSTPLIQNVTLVDTNTSVATSKTPTVYGEPITFTATVTSTQGTPAGTVTFKDGASSLGTSTLNGSGVATLTTSALSVNSHSITAQYNGNSNFNGSTSSAITQLVNKANTMTTITADSPDPSVAGQTITVNYSVQAASPGSGTPTGNVVITIDGASDTCTGTIAAGSCNITLTGSIGTHTLTATYSGDTNFNASQGTALHTIGIRIYLPIIVR